MPTLQSVFRGIDRFNYVLMALSGIVLFGMVMRSDFVQPIRVENRTAAPLSFTPVAAWHPDRRRAPVPLVIGKTIPLPAWRFGRFPLAPGESITLWYDTDDCDLSELVVYADGADARCVTLMQEPGGPAVALPGNDAYWIDDVDKLPPPTPHALAGADEAESRSWTGYVAFYGLLFGPWAAFIVFRLCLRGTYVSPAEKEAWENWAMGQEGT